MFSSTPVLTVSKEFDRFPEGLVKIDYKSTCADGATDWAYAWNPADSSGIGVIVLHGHGSHGDQLYTWRQTLSWCDAFCKRALNPHGREQGGFHTPRS